MKEGSAQDATTWADSSERLAGAHKISATGDGNELLRKLLNPIHRRTKALLLRAQFYKCCLPISNHNLLPDLLAID